MTRGVRALTIASGLAMAAALGMIVFAAVDLRRPGVSAPAGVNGGDGGPSGGMVAAGKMAPDFTLLGLDGKTVSLATLRGKVVFLNLWATWCPPCRTEMPSIESLSRAFKDNSDFVTLTVSEDSDVKQPPAFIKQNKFNFTVLLDPRSTVGEAYGVSGLPESFVIGRDGRIVAHHVGPYDWANPDIREALQDLLKSKSG
jgi:peroxiredoxin